MTLQADGYFDWAWRLDCDLRLIRDGGKLIELRPNRMEFITGHSMEGHVWITPEIRQLAGKGPKDCTPAERARVVLALNAAYWAFRDPSRPTTAWHLTNLRGVRALIQHAPITARLAHGHAANPHAPGCEHEGVAGTPIDEYQVATSLRVTRDLNEAYGRKFDWHQHNQYGPTACPSNRLARLLAALAQALEEVEMASAEYIELKAAYETLLAASFGTPERLEAMGQYLPVEERLDRMERQDGWLDKRIDKIEAAIEVLQTASPEEVRALAEQITKLGAALAGIHQATAA